MQRVRRDQAHHQESAPKNMIPDPVKAEVPEEPQTQTSEVPEELQPLETQEPQPGLLPDEEEPVDVIKKHFAALLLSDVAIDRFKSVAPSRFEDMMEFALHRVSPYVHFACKATDPDMVANQVRTSPFYAQLNTDAKILYAWQAGTASESLHLERLTRPYKYTPSVGKTDVENAFKDIFVKMDGGGSLFDEHQSMIVATDGRRSAGTKVLMAVFNKLTKEAGTCKTPFAFRLMHSNAEFTSADALHRRLQRANAMRSGCPDPLETLVLVFSKKYGIKTRARKFIDLPGTNQTRGLNNVPLKTPSGIRVRWGKRTDVLAGSSKVAGVAEDVMPWLEGPKEQGEAEKSTDNNDEDKLPDKNLDDEPCDVFPWEHCELLHREVINMFEVDAIVDMTPGSGMLALAAARHAKYYYGLVRNKAHHDVCLQTVLAHVVTELIESKSDGFGHKRFLSRVRSLAGSVDDAQSVCSTKTAASVKTEEVKAEEQQPRKEQRAAGSGSDSSDSDS